MNLYTALIVGIPAFALGTWLGQWIADSEWRSKGEPNATRMYSGGRFYCVSLEGSPTLPTEGQEGGGK